MKWRDSVKYQQVSIVAIFFVLLIPRFLLADAPVIQYPMESTKIVKNDLDVLIQDFRFKFPYKDAKTENWKKQYLNNKFHMKSLMTNMAPFLPFITKKLKEYDLPGEIALIPLVESCYRIRSSSQVGALGLWQINGITAEHFKLEDSWNYEARLDILHSTDMALKYIKQLHDTFNSWPLVFAAYNAGPNRVKEALKKVNYRSEADFIKLKLPTETMDYVPKIMALAHIVKYYDYYKIPLPHKVDHLVEVPCHHPTDFRDVILALNIPLQTLTKYNCCYSSYSIPKNHNGVLFIPGSYIQGDIKLTSEKIKYFNKKPVYQVKQGDTLTKISKQFNHSVDAIISCNSLKNDNIKPGQILLIPPISDTFLKLVDYKVKKGDSLSSIARAHDCSVEQIKKVNELVDSKIIINQMIKIPMGKK